MIIILILICLLVLALRHIINKAGTGGSCCSGGRKMEKKVKVSDKNKANYPYIYKISIEGMVCAGCVRNVENAINSADGLWARVDLENKEVTVRAKREMSREDFIRIFASTSYTPVDVQQVNG
jgi:copper chaperone CopZ